MLYLAPLQGYTDVFYRSALQASIGGIDKFFTPFFEFEPNKPFDWPNRWELSATLNQNQYLVPQLVAKDVTELKKGALFFKSHGFNEINLNLGCPFPMLVKRQRGCGALPFSEATAQMLEEFFAENVGVELSIKTRLGLNATSELPALLSRINSLPIKELIIHFRLGIDQYKGDVRWEEMEKIRESTHFKIVANGDITTPQELLNLKQRFPFVNDWMMGRGVLINPLLAREIEGLAPTWGERLESYKLLHKTLMNNLLEADVEQNRFMNSIKGYWFYHSQYYTEGRKINKEISKTKNLTDYNALVSKVWKSTLSPLVK